MDNNIFVEKIKIKKQQQQQQCYKILESLPAVTKESIGLSTVFGFEICYMMPIYNSTQILLTMITNFSTRFELKCDFNTYLA